jgi:hypothetical protein
MVKHRSTSWCIAGVALAAALLFSLLSWVSLSQSALAQSDQPEDALASITVNTTDPAINDDGLCSVVEAVTNANVDAVIYDDCAIGSGNDTISLPADAVIIFTVANNNTGGSNALPVITSTMTIRGNGATLVRNAAVAPNFRFFHVAAGGNLTLNELGLNNGYAEIIASTVQLFLGGGAIINEGTLHINDSSLSFNQASFGGAIYSQPITGSLSINNTRFTSNRADFTGGALQNAGRATITGGILRLNEAGTDGGAILHESSTMTVTNATLQDNIADGSGAGILARAVTTDSRLSIQTTNLISNVASINAGAIYNTASNGLTSSVEIAGSTLSANRADSTNSNEGAGGGILNGWAQGNNGGVARLVVSKSSVLDNVAQSGGGIANLDATGYATRTAQILITQSTLARNTAAGLGSQRGSGGGLFNKNGVATVANSTFSANQALGDDITLGGRGGAIVNIGGSITTTLHLLNSTLANNEASQAGGAIAVVRQLTTTATAMEVGNSLIVSNALTITQSVSNAAVLAALVSPQVITGTDSCSLEGGTSTSLGGNIEDHATCGFNLATDLKNTDVALGALADNGGPTLTHLISSGGPASERGIDAICNAAPVNGVDQRGVERPQVTHCDTGAIELEGATSFFPQIYLRFSFH